MGICTSIRFFGLVQYGRLAAILDVNMGCTWGVSDRNSGMLGRIPFKFGMIMDLPMGHMQLE